MQRTYVRWVLFVGLATFVPLFYYLGQWSEDYSHMVASCSLRSVTLATLQFFGSA